MDTGHASHPVPANAALAEIAAEAALEGVAAVPGRLSTGHETLRLGERVLVALPSGDVVEVGPRLAMLAAAVDADATTIPAPAVTL